MTRQTWTAAVSAFCFLWCALVVAVAPAPFVAYSPGSTYDLLGSSDGKPAIAIGGVATFPAQGEIRIASVNVTSPDDPVALPEVLHAYWAADRDAFPVEWRYPTRATAVEARSRDAANLNAAQTQAVAAALSAAGIEVRRVPMVASVASVGPAIDKLFPGDFVLEVDGEATPTASDVRAAIGARAVGEPVTFTILRDSEVRAVTISTVASNTQAGQPVWGGTLTMGYSHNAKVEFSREPPISSAGDGLVLALAVFDLVTVDDLAAGRVVAGAGTIDGAGVVGRVNGIRQKLAAAEQAGATIFLVPADNCVDLADQRPSLARIVKVTSLDDAIASLDALQDPSMSPLVRGC